MFIRKSVRSSLILILVNDSDEINYIQKPRNIYHFILLYKVYGKKLLDKRTSKLCMSSFYDN